MPKIIVLLLNKVHTTRYFFFYAKRSINPTDIKPKLISSADLKDMTRRTFTNAKEFKTNKKLLTED